MAQGPVPWGEEAKSSLMCDFFNFKFWLKRGVIPWVPV